VGTILEGSVRKDGDQIRITAQFINANDGSHIWSESFDRELSDIFKIQDELAQSISESLLSSFNISKSGNPSREKIVNDEAYNLYLLGQHYRSKNVEILEGYKENFHEAVKLYKQSIELDSSFTDAFVGLANAYAHFGYLFGESEIKNVWELAESNTVKALELDGSHARALASMAYIKRNKYWDWEGAQEYYRKAISAAPGNDKTLENYALLLSAINQHDSAMFYARRALELNPKSRNSRFTFMRTAYYARNYQIAVKQSEKLNQLSKGTALNSGTVLYTISILFQTEQDKAVSMILDYAPIDETSKEKLATIYQTQGWKSLMKSIYNSPYKDQIPTGHILMDGAPKDVIFQELTAQIRDKVGRLVYILVDPIYDPVRLDPRFDELLETMKLDKYK